MSKKTRRKNGQTPDDDWRQRAFGDYSATSYSSQSRRLGASISGDITSISKQIGSHTFRNNKDITEYFYALGASAPSQLMWDLFFDPTSLPSEARKLGINSARQIAEGLAVKQLDSPSQMRLALAAYEAGVRGDEKVSHQPPLGFENRKIASLAGQKAAVTEIKEVAHSLKTNKHISDQDVVDLGYRWGKAAVRIGLSRHVEPNLIRDADDRRDAIALKLDTPTKLAEGAMLGKLQKSEADPEHFALFKLAFQAGATGERKPAAGRSKIAIDVASLIETPSLKNRFTAHVKAIEKDFETGLTAIKDAKLSPEQPIAERAAALHLIEQKVAHYADASRTIAKATKQSLNDPMPIIYQAEIKSKLTGEEASGFTMLEGIDTGLATEKKLLPNQARLFSPTGLLEASVLGAMNDKKVGLTSDEAVRILSRYRSRIQDKTPVTTDQKLTFSTGVLQTISPFLLADKLVVTSPSVTLPATSIKTDEQKPLSQEQQRAYLHALEELMIINNGVQDDLKAAKSLKRDGLLTGRISNDSITTDSSRALAAKGLKLAAEALEDSSISAEEFSKMQALRKEIADAFKGKPVASDASLTISETTDRQSTMNELRLAHQRAKSALAREK